jgi:lipopolysaccharide transport system ATP-binding protein
MSNAAIKIQGLSKRYRIGARERGYKTIREAVADRFLAPLRGWSRIGQGGRDEENIWALKDVSFEVEAGEVIGIIGRNGAGKSTLLKILSRITQPTQGYAEIYGRVGSLLEVGTGFHPELTGRENIFLNGAILGMKKNEIKRKFDEIVVFSEIEKFIDTPVKRYSSGMYMRLAFAVAAHLEPEILVIDEVLAVGDAGFQKKCLGKMGAVAKEGRTVLFVSHNMAAIQQLCGRGILLSQGQVLTAGKVDRVIGEYLAEARPERMEKDGYLIRNASGTVEITSVGFLDEGDRRMSGGQCGEDLKIAIQMQTARRYERVAVSVSVNNQHGVRVSVMHSKIAGYEFNLEAGKNIIRCAVPRLPLLPGRYLLDLKIIAGYEVLLWEPHLVEMNVEGGDFHNTGKISDAEWGGFFCMDQKWETLNAS